MIRYRLSHEDLPGLYICKWCGATDESIWEGRKPRYCAKNKRFKAPGAYISYGSLVRMFIEAHKFSKDGIPVSLVDVLRLAEEPPVGFQGWGFPKIMEAFDQAFEDSARDGVGLYSISHPIPGELPRVTGIALRDAYLAEERSCDEKPDQNGDR